MRRSYQLSDNTITIQVTFRKASFNTLTKPLKTLFKKCYVFSKLSIIYIKLTFEYVFSGFEKYVTYGSKHFIAYLLVSQDNTFYIYWEKDATPFRSVVNLPFMILSKWQAIIWHVISDPHMWWRWSHTICTDHLMRTIRWTYRRTAR